ncbi:MAG: DUF5681 domain-containing protein [Alphaproteobacteria bacterium]
MSKKNCTDGRRNNRPPKEHQFKPGQSGNPQGRPPVSDRMQRFSIDSFRKFIMNDAWKEIEIVESGRRKMVPKFYVIISQLNNKAAKGDIAATRLATKLLESAASGNDKDLFEWMTIWAEWQERKLKASCNPGSLEHFDVMYQYYMFKRDVRRVEGTEAWPFEDDEPYDDADWRVFIKYHDRLKKDPKSIAPWPLDFPSNDPKMAL